MRSAISLREAVAAPEHERSALTRAEHLLDGLDDQSARRILRLVGASGQELELPESAVRLLRQIVHHLAKGASVAVVPFHREVTTEEAADLLNVPTAYLAKLLEQGDIPYTKAGTQRRIRLDDLMAYKEKRDSLRRRALTELTQMSQELGLYGEAQRRAE